MLCCGFGALVVVALVSVVLAFRPALVVVFGGAALVSVVVALVLVFGGAALVVVALIAAFLCSWLHPTLFC